MRKKRSPHTSKSMAQKSSIGANTLHFFTCEEPARINSLADKAGGLTLNATDSVNLQLSPGSEPGKNVNMLSIGTPSTKPSGGNWAKVGSDDWAIFTCGKCINAGVEDWDGGVVNFYYGSVSQGQLRVQPYFAVWKKGDTDSEIGSVYNQIATPVYYPMMRRNEGQTYIFGAVKRGQYLEHWVDGIMVGRVDIELLLQSISQVEDSGNKEKLQQLYNTWYNHDSEINQDVSFGHGSYNLVVNTITSGDLYLPHLALSEYPHHDPEELRREIPETWGSDVPNGYDGGVANLAQDFRAKLIQKFPEGTPEDIGESMLYHKEQWTLGNKVVWGPWYI